MASLAPELAPTLTEWWRDVWPLVPEPDRGRPGDPGLFGPGSVSWRVARERVLLAAGGGSLLLQIAHPKVAAGVAEHSAFRAAPYARLGRTLDAVMRLTFGDGDAAGSAVRQVGRVHERVRGALPIAAGPFPAGDPYDATDPALGMWVHATLVHGWLVAYQSLVGPLAHRDRAAFFEEQKAQAALFGVEERTMPPTYEAFLAYWRSMVSGPELVVTASTREIAAGIIDPPVPAALGPANRLLRSVTAGMLPARFRREFGFAWGPADRAAFRAVCAASRALVPLAPLRVRTWPHYRAAVRRVRAGA